MDSTSEDNARITNALTDQKTIQQLSSTGYAAKEKRAELKRIAAAKKEKAEAAGKTAADTQGKTGETSGDRAS
ncbi:hypothetical protein M430DRAFT_33504 [Amorphotheca resinae ATCC 22711]|uniref:Uncharacterized protein n=1 Tax=Amorphotheca resinae ATCC 22711 TaxID=857342 RepID=A0A2T3B7E0_AMORE|nr:hypothetical protein M430DRAFT_33504 [Amorphotheca resinae ATCC 22711]PSS22757.1 hypothetical protein M430DRAFT_33504 [Amorphotheca resinae ATCC 22711]